MSDANVWAPSSVALLSADTKKVEQVILASAAQTLFTITAFAYVMDVGTLDVYKNGLRLARGFDWDETSTTSFTLRVGAAALDEIIAVGYIGLTGEVVATTTDSTTNNSDVAGSTCSDALETLDTAVDGLTTAISGFGDDITSLEAAVEDLEDEDIAINAELVSHDSRLDALEAAISGGAGNSQYAVCTTNQNVSNTTLTNATELSGVLNIAVNSTYHFEASIVFGWNLSAGSAGVKFQFNVPAGATLISLSNWKAHAGGSENVDATLVQSGVTYTYPAAESYNGAFRHTMVGTIRSGATAGTLAFQFAQETADANSVNLGSACFIKLTKMI